jgi:O-antigen ligase
MIRDPLRAAPWLLLAAALAAAVVYAPLPFGAVTATGRTTLQLAAAVSLLLAAFCRPAAGWRGAALPAAALFAVAGWGLLQAAPLPTGLVAALSPEAAELQLRAAALVERPVPERLHLSLTPDLSRRNASWWAAAGMALLAAAIAGRRRALRRVLACALLAAAGFQVLYGSQRWTSSASLIWGVTVPGSGQRLRGTFVNPDHLAFFLELPLAACGAWIWWAVRRARAAAGLERRLLLLAPPLLVWLGLFAAIAFTGSRAGLLAALAATAAQGVAAAVRGRRWRLAPAGVGLGLLGLAAVAGVGLQQGLGRWLATTPYDVSWAARRGAYEATFELWQRFPWTGTGMASFRFAFPLAQPASIPAGWWHAHNDWLEALATLGLPGALVLLAGLLALVHRLFVVLGGDSRSEDRAAALAGYGALVAAGVHSALDFGLTLPANAFVLAVLLGAATGAPAHLSAAELARRRRRGRRPATPPQPHPDDDAPPAGASPPAPTAP